LPFKNPWGRIGHCPHPQGFFLSIGHLWARYAPGPAGHRTVTPFFLSAPLLRGLVYLLALLVLSGCGPRSDANGSSGVTPSGEVPFINQFFSRFPTPDWRIEGSDVVFAAGFDIRASDADGDMQRLLVTVNYTDCDGVDQTLSDLVYWLTIQESVSAAVRLVGKTNTEVRVPLSCYALGGQFTISGRILDQGHNLSNIHSDSVTITANQGSTG